MKNNRLIILSNKTGEPFADGLGKYLGEEPVQIEMERHPDGEVKLHINKSIRGSDVYLICPYYPNPMERHTETLLMVDAIKYASAGRITVVPTYLGFQRSDWKDKSRVPIGIRVILESLEVAGADRLLSMQLHARQIQGMSRMPFDVLEALPVFRGWCDDMGYESENTVVVSADSGGTKYTEACASIIDASGMGMIWKKRLGGDSVDIYGYSGDPVGSKNVLMPDDQFATGTSMRKGAKRLKEKEGATSVYGFTTHGVFAPKNGRPAEDLLMEDKYLDMLAVTDTIPRPDGWKAKYKDKIEVRSVIPNFGEAIKRIHMDESLSDLFQY